MAIIINKIAFDRTEIERADKTTDDSFGINGACIDLGAEGLMTITPKETGYWQSVSFSAVDADGFAHDLELIHDLDGYTVVMDGVRGVKYDRELLDAIDPLPDAAECICNPDDANDLISEWLADNAEAVIIPTFSGAELTQLDVYDDAEEAAADGVPAADIEHAQRCERDRQFELLCEGITGSCAFKH